MTHYIYIPGFGDFYDPLRRLIVGRWKSEDVAVTLVPMRWNDRKETYEQRYERIAGVIKQAEGDEIILVGESAGGAMALLTFSRQLNQVNSIVTVCGYNHGAGAVHSLHRLRRPGFYHMMPVVDKVVKDFSATDRRRITTIYSTGDRVVAPRYSRIEGAREVVLHSLGHFTNIARVLIGKLPLQHTD